MRISDWSSDVCSSDLAFVAALGGAANLVSVEACTTRLRLIVADQSAVDDAALSALGARGIILPSENAAQVVLGPVADLVAEEVRGALAGDRKRTRLNSSHSCASCMPSTACKQRRHHYFAIYTF